MLGRNTKEKAVLYLICNTRAKRCKQKLLKKVGEKLHAAGMEYEIFSPQREEDIAPYVHAVAQRESNPTLVAVGGDGTVNAVLCAIPDPSRVNFGIIPAGTGNDFAKSARIPMGLKAVDLLISGAPKPTDYLQGEGRRSMNIAGLGIDVDILERYERNLRAGKKGKYYACLLASLKEYRPLRMRVETEHGVEEYDALIAAGCNGQYFGGGIHICPSAVLDDGLMDLVVIEYPNRKKIFFYLMALKLGKILKMKISHRILCERLTISPQTGAGVQFDGELVSSEALSLRVVKGGINVYRG